MEKDFMIDQLVELQKVFDSAYDAIGDIIDAIETEEEERECDIGVCTIGDETFYVARYVDTGEIVRGEMSYC